MIPEIGVKLQDRIGEYTVLGVSADKTRLVYSYEGNPLEYVSDLEVKVRIHDNIQGERIRAFQAARKFKYADEPELQPFIEHLIDKGRIEANLPEKDFEAFRERYQEVTGQWTGDDAIGVSFNGTKRALSLSVMFPAKNAVMPPDGWFNVTDDGKHGKHYLVISKNEFAWELLEIGFRLGIEHRRRKP